MLPQWFEVGRPKIANTPIVEVHAIVARVAATILELAVMVPNRSQARILGDKAFSDHMYSWVLGRREARVYEMQGRVEHGRHGPVVVRRTLERL